MQKEPLVSVIMSAYNAESTLETAIESILSQSFSNFEFLIMNDGSNDMTSEIIENYSQNDKRIRVFQNEKNKGLTKSLNILINLSKGKYIARQDADDFSVYSRLSSQITFLTENNFDACSSRAINIQTKKKIPGKSFYIPLSVQVKFKNPIIHGTLVIKKEVLSELGNYDELFYYAQDYKLVTDIIKSNYKFKNMNLILYHLNTENNISTTFPNKQKYFSDCVKKGIKPVNKF